ncbi:hypothetical protein MAR_006809 [Mya arenaria]|uniref:Uncharacterized protein n=1 Tax=Mya arenaria TaxID=6604 RepID=A0ABY7DAN9_MYAAR|nr:hypothetical protein MAR_006809 [Mya arenaria]
MVVEAYRELLQVHPSHLHVHQLFVTYCRTDQRALMFPSVTFNDGSQNRLIRPGRVRGHVINKLSEIDAKDAQIVNALSLTLSTVVKKPDQITSKAKTQSVSIYSKLVKAYKNSSAEVTQTDLAVTARY